MMTLLCSKANFHKKEIYLLHKKVLSTQQQDHYFDRIFHFNIMINAIKNRFTHYKCYITEKLF